MKATMYGCEIVCSRPIGSGLSSYDRDRMPSGTNRWRGTLRIASRTRALVMSRACSWSLTICRRSAFQSRGSRWRPAALGAHATQTSTAATRSRETAFGVTRVFLAVPIVLTDVLEDLAALDPGRCGLLVDLPPYGPRRRVGARIVDRRLVGQRLQV